MSDNKPVLLAAIGILTAAAEDAVKALDAAPELKSISLSVKSGMQRVINTLTTLSGTSLGSTLAEEFPPLEQMFGETIDRQQPVDAANIVSPSVKDAFLQKRKELYKQFPELTNEQVHARIKEPEGESLVRSIAKKAGYENYLEGELTDVALDEIRSLIVAANEKGKAVKAASDAAAKPDAAKGKGKNSKKETTDAANIVSPSEGEATENEHTPAE